MSRKLTIDLIISEMKIQNISGLLALNINGKSINDISILSQIPSLEIISLNNNDINNLSAFKNLKNLKKLSLKGNRINDFNQIDFLRYCPKLEYLKLKDNPIEKEKNYYKIILDKLPKLKILDDFETNKINNKENISQDNKNIDGINNESKYIKLKIGKNRNNFNTYNPNPYMSSPMKIVNLKNNNNNINQQQIIKKSSNEKIIPDNNNINNNNKIVKDNSKNERQNDNEEDDFEIININDEKKKIEKENKKFQKVEPKAKAEVTGYSFKKKSSTGYFFYDPKKRKVKNKVDSNISLENVNLNNDFLNTLNEKHKNLLYNFSTSKYNRKIIGGIHNNNALSQSIRYDDGDEENNKNGIYSTKNKLAGIKSRLLNNISNKIYNKSNNLNNNDKDNKEIEKEKKIIQSVKLLITNLDKEELNQLNDSLINIIKSKSKK